MNRPQRKRVPVEEFCKCFGYYGFGTGWVMGELAVLGKRKKDGTEGYCSADCPVAQECWDRHKKRVREMFTALCEQCEEIYKTYPGPEGFERVMELCEGKEPFLTVMMGNIGDGTAAAGGLAMFDRGEEHSLTWPLQELSP